MEFDEILEKVGNSGQFQRKYNYFYNIGLVFFASMSYMNIIWILNEPDHQCLVSGRDNFNLSLEEWREKTIPM